MKLEFLPFKKKEAQKTKEMNPASARVESSFDAISPEIFGKFNEGVVRRLVALEEYSKFNLDSRMIESGMKNVLSEIARRDQGFELTEERLAEARIAALIHDIGKSGPLTANPDQQLAVVRLFAAENLRNPKQSVEDGVRESFGEEANLILFNLQNAGVDTNIPMMKFWESHARWGFEIIANEFPSLSETTKNIAILHHVDKGPEFNFLNMPMDQIPREALVLGQLKNYVDVLRQRAIIAVDQYEARIRRGKVSHEDAISWVRENTSKTFGEDAFMKLVLDVMLEMGQQKIFYGEVE